MISFCPKGCTHSAQDSMYGKGKRVFNSCKKGTAMRCTVCGAEVQLSGAQIKESKTAPKKEKR